MIIFQKPRRAFVEKHMHLVLVMCLRKALKQAWNSVARIIDHLDMILAVYCEHISLIHNSNLGSLMSRP